MSQPAIKVEGLWKEYTVGAKQKQHNTFYDLLAQTLKAPFSRPSLTDQVDQRDKQFWALQDINFEIQPGEVVGVIGRNGAGKSTLLKLLSRIAAPSKGRIEVRGRLASLLEVGTGFHPELSGRENIYLNGSILGMSRQEISRKFDEIVEFSEVETFIDTAVKRYSSCMYVRLAFAVAAHLETDVLLVDEVLAVGDAEFQRKSLGKMNEVAKAGRTVVFVSHNLAAVRALCSKAILLDGGRTKYIGQTSEALANYESKFHDSGGKLHANSFSGPLAPHINFNNITYQQDNVAASAINPMRPFVIELNGTALKNFPQLELNVALYRDGFHLTSFHDAPPEKSLAIGNFVSKITLHADTLRPGSYSIGIGASTSKGDWLWGADVATLQISADLGGRAAHRVAGAVALQHAAERIQATVA